MKKVCLSLLIIPLFLIFLLLSSIFSTKTFAGNTYGSCSGNFAICGNHGCPGGGETEYECCPNCDDATVCRDRGTGCGPGKNCSNDGDCLDNPYCGPTECSEIKCINGACVSNCKSCSGGPGPEPTTPPGHPEQPVCNISMNNEGIPVKVGDARTFTVTGSSNAQSTAIYSWPPVWWVPARNTCNGGICTAYIPFNTAGTYWVLGQAYTGLNSSGLKCTRDPFCTTWCAIYGTCGSGTTYACPGWYDCGADCLKKITVTLPLPTCAIWSEPSQSITKGTATTIKWDSTNADNCQITPDGWTGVSGSHDSGILNADKTYTGTCSNATGTSPVCAYTVHVYEAIPWMQVQGGDVHGNGSVGTTIPSTCVGTCQPYLIIE